MRLGRLTVLAVLAVAFAACMKDNPNYCGNAPDAGFNCLAADAAAHAEHPSPDAGDAADGDALGDVDAPGDVADAAMDLVVEKPMCTLAGCPDEAPICDVDAGVCGACATNAECKAHDSTKPTCDPADHRCYECVANADCTTDPTKPICTNHACGRCVLDSDCKAAPGICMEDGSCLAASDAVFATLRDPGKCPGAGTATDPFCTAQLAATTALSTAKKAVVLMGPGPFSVFAVKAPGKQLAVIAPDRAALVPGIDNGSGTPQVGLSLQDGDLLVRGLEVKNGQTTAIESTGGTIRLRRCFIHDNAGPGLSVAGAGFEVENTVFANNGGPSKPNIDLENAAAAPEVFRNNTVVSASSTLTGVVCASAYALTNSIIFGGATRVGPACVFTDTCAKDCSTATSLNLNPATYELTSTSPAACIDAIDPSMAPTLDRLGTVRPQGAKSDCGADEFSAQ
jgi:hypothetical protein